MFLRYSAIFLATFLTTLPAISRGQSSISIDGFEGPNSAPLYVIEGYFSRSLSLGDLNFVMNWSMAMNPGSETIGGRGNLSVNGTFPYGGYWWPLSLRGSLGVALKALQAGNIVRVNGKLGVNGRGSIAGYQVQKFYLNYFLTNFEIDPSAGNMTGTLRGSGGAQVMGYNLPVSLPAQVIDFPMPDVDGIPGWDSNGHWTIQLQAAADRKGNVKGGGRLTVFDQSGDPYDVISQKISGTVRNGNVSLQAVGRNPATTRARFSLIYPQSEDPKSSYLSGGVSAYGQRRGF